MPAALTRAGSNPRTSANTLQVRSDPEISIIMLETYEIPGGGSWVPHVIVEALKTVQRVYHVFVADDQTIASPYRRVTNNPMHASNFMSMTIILLAHANHTRPYITPVVQDGSFHVVATLPGLRPRSHCDWEGISGAATDCARPHNTDACTITTTPHTPCHTPC